MVREQRLYELVPEKKMVTKLTYMNDTVYVEKYRQYGIGTYQAIKLTTFKTEPYVISDMKYFGWAIWNNSGSPVDSAFFINDHMTIYKRFYDNGQLERHEYIEDAKVKRIDYKENGKIQKRMRNRGRNIFRSNRLYIPDSTDIQFYSTENKAIFMCAARFDTSIIKLHTWFCFINASHQLISDSSYHREGKLIREQKIYSRGPDKRIDMKFLYYNDTVTVESSSWNGIENKYIAAKSTDTYSMGEYEKFDWYVTRHNDGYVMDSIFYENGIELINKQFYDTGQLKSHRYQTPNGFETVEYKENGKIRNRFKLRVFNH
jgi:hypothetical protein